MEQSDRRLEVDADGRRVAVHHEAGSTGELFVRLFWRISREWSPPRGRKTLVNDVCSQSLARAGSSAYVDASHGGAVDVNLENFSFTGNYNL